MRWNSLLKVFSAIGFVTVTGEHTIRSDLKSHPNWNLLYRGDACGDSYPHFRIIGGTQAALGQYPWVVRLGYSTNKPKKGAIKYSCGGSIISERYILTAAHCGPDIMKASLVSVAVGEYDTKTDPDCKKDLCAPPVQNIKVESVTCHKDFNDTNSYNDICLVRLAKQVVFNDYLTPICLPVYNFLSKDNNSLIMEVAGWGITNIRKKTRSNVLQTLKVSVVPFDKCSAQWASKGIKLLRKQMCAGGIVGQDSCNGDSGGPLMRPFSIQAPPRYFLIGVVSFGPKQCAETDVPGVYTKVADYMRWILDHVRP